MHILFHEWNYLLYSIWNEKEIVIALLNCGFITFYQRVREIFLYVLVNILPRRILSRVWRTENDHHIGNSSRFDLAVIREGQVIEDGRMIVRHKVGSFGCGMSIQPIRSDTRSGLWTYLWSDILLIDIIRLFSSILVLNTSRMILWKIPWNFSTFYLSFCVRFVAKHQFAIT